MKSSLTDADLGKQDVQNVDASYQNGFADSTSSDVIEKTSSSSASSSASLSPESGIFCRHFNGHLSGHMNGLKLFIGQIPRHMNEIDLRPVFEEFGPVSDLLVLRDKLTGIHKGKRSFLLKNECT